MPHCSHEQPAAVVALHWSGYRSLRSDPAVLGCEGERTMTLGMRKQHRGPHCTPDHADTAAPEPGRSVCLGGSAHPVHRRELCNSSPGTRWFGRSWMCLGCGEVWERGAILGQAQNQRLLPPGRASATRSPALLLRSLQTRWCSGGGLGTRETISQG